MDDLTRLAHAARFGERRALEAFLRASHSHVWHYCAATVDEATADDLAQETLIRSVSAIRRFRSDASALTWLLAIARHTCADELRSRTRRQNRETTYARSERSNRATPDPADEVTTRDLLTHLDPERRDAFVLTQIIGLTYNEAASICACPTGTVRSRVARARADLIELLDTSRSYGNRTTTTTHPHQPRSES